MLGLKLNSDSKRGPKSSENVFMFIIRDYCIIYLENNLKLYENWNAEHTWTIGFGDYTDLLWWK